MGLSNHTVWTSSLVPSFGDKSLDLACPLFGPTFAVEHRSDTFRHTLKAFGEMRLEFLLPGLLAFGFLALRPSARSQALPSICLNIALPVAMPFASATFLSSTLHSTQILQPDRSITVPQCPTAWGKAWIKALSLRVHLGGHFFSLIIS